MLPLSPLVGRFQKGELGGTPISELAARMLGFTKAAPFFPAKIFYPFFRRNTQRKRSFMERIHVMMVNPASSVLGHRISVFVMAVIVISCVSLVLETLPSSSSYTSECSACAPLRGSDREDEVKYANRIALRDDCAGCEPVAAAWLGRIEVFGITVFTLEYLLKLFTAHAHFSEAEEQAILRQHTELKFNTRRLALSLSTNSISQEDIDQNLLPFFPPPSIALRLRRTVMFVLRPMNLLDLIAISPFYIEVFTGGSVGGSLAVLRLLRLLRVFRLLRHKKLKEGVFIMSAAVSRSTLNLVVFLLFTFFVAILMASLVFYAEVGTWDKASGEYLREDVRYPHEPNKPSLYTSIPVSFWWVLVTFSTVGYGDIAPTTTLGQFLGVVTIFSGTILLAMPITIMGVSLTEVYSEQTRAKKRTEKIATNAAKLLAIVGRGRAQVNMQRAWNKWVSVAKEYKTQKFVFRRQLEGAMEECGVFGPDPIARTVQREMETLKRDVLKFMCTEVEQFRLSLVEELESA